LDVNQMKSSSTAVITGVSTGIGYETARTLAERGFHVFGSVRRTVDADRLSAELGDQFTPLQFDLRDAQAIRTAADLVRSSLRGQRLGALVNNASICLGGPLALQSIDEIRQQFEVNVIGTVAVPKSSPLYWDLIHRSREIPEGLSISAQSVGVSGFL
jgi:hypothetical protein